MVPNWTDGGIRILTLRLLHSHLISSLQRGDGEVKFLQNGYLIKSSASLNYFDSLMFPNILILRISKLTTIAFLDLDNKPFLPSPTHMAYPPPPPNWVEEILGSRAEKITVDRGIVPVRIGITNRLGPMLKILRRINMREEVGWWWRGGGGGPPPPPPPPSPLLLYPTVSIPDLVIPGVQILLLILVLLIIFALFLPAHCLPILLLLSPHLHVMSPPRIFSCHHLIYRLLFHDIQRHWVIKISGIGDNVSVHIIILFSSPSSSLTSSAPHMFLPPLLLFLPLIHPLLLPPTPLLFLIDTNWRSGRMTMMCQ